MKNKVDGPTVVGASDSSKSSRTIRQSDKDTSVSFRMENRELAARNNMEDEQVAEMRELLAHNIAHSEGGMIKSMFDLSNRSFVIMIICALLLIIPATFMALNSKNVFDPYSGEQCTIVKIDPTNKFWTSYLDSKDDAYADTQVIQTWNCGSGRIYKTYNIARVHADGTTYWLAQHAWEKNGGPRAVARTPIDKQRADAKSNREEALVQHLRQLAPTGTLSQ